MPIYSFGSWPQISVEIKNRVIAALEGLWTYVEHVPAQGNMMFYSVFSLLYAPVSVEMKARIIAVLGLWIYVENVPAQCQMMFYSVFSLIDGPVSVEMKTLIIAVLEGLWNDV